MPHNFKKSLENNRYIKESVNRILNALQKVIKLEKSSWNYFQYLDFVEGSNIYALDEILVLLDFLSELIN